MLVVTPRTIGENTKEYSYRLVKNAIMSLQLQPGQSIREADLAASLHISRTPIREVMAKLKEEHLVDVLPQIGTYVSKINYQLIEEAAFMRFTLEKEILKLSCRTFSKKSLKELKRIVAQQEELICEKEYVQEFHQLDKQFHSLIFRENKKEHIWEGIMRLSTHYNRMRLLSEMNNSFDEAIKQHQEIIQLIENQDMEYASQIAYQHIIEPKRKWKQFLEEDSQYLHYFDVQ
jgi:DNA-binding GntR family transcriptional regulator